MNKIPSSLPTKRRQKTYSLLETKISKTRIMTSQKGGFVWFSKEEQNHDSKNWIKSLLSNKTSLHTEQPPPHPSPSFPSTLHPKDMYYCGKKFAPIVF